jgi:tetratricopeptide (TPR) repeat protein
MEFLASASVQTVLQQTWGRNYIPFRDRPTGWLANQIQELVDLRLLERVGSHGQEVVIDAHPLVRRGFENVLGPAGKEHSGQARAGFLRGRPDRRPPATLNEAREEVELFHAYCDAGLWNEADGVYVALDNPKHRFLAPAFERDLLLSFFPDNDWQRLPCWPGFGRYRSLAICFELLGQFEDALAAYRSADAPLRGDALIALGRLEPLLDQATVPQPWQALWQAYRAHALCLAGKTTEAIALAKSLVPVDVYEWVHVFECVLRCEALHALDLNSVLYRPPLANEHQWSSLARRRMRADYLRISGKLKDIDLENEYRELVEAYDRSGLPYERALTRLGYARWLLVNKQRDQADSVNAVTLDLARRHGMGIIEVDALELSQTEQDQASQERQAM